MPNIQSAKKRLRQNLRSRERNRAIKSEIKSEMRKLFDALTSGDIPAAREHFRLVAKKTDRAKVIDAVADVASERAAYKENIII